MSPATRFRVALGRLGVWRLLMLIRWLRQGCPLATVTTVGQLLIQPDGQRVVTGWGFAQARGDYSFLGDGDALWEHLALRFPDAIRWAEPTR